MALFDEFWKAYPKKRRQKKPTAKKKFERLDLAHQLMVIDDVKERAVHDKQWLDGFMPGPAVYLHNEQWDDAWEYVRGSSERNHYQETEGGLSAEDYFKLTGRKL